MKDTRTARQSGRGDGSWAARLAGSRVHYGWMIAALGMATVFACLGVARFSLGMLLPSMRADMNLSYTDMGFISTGNFVGYLVAALVCGRLVRRFGARAVVFFSLVIIAASLFVVASASAVTVIWPAYLVTGLGSGAANVGVMSLVPHWFSRRWRGRAAGIMVIGSGPAIMMSGLLIPAITARWGPAGWRIGWVCLAVVVLVVALVVGVLIRNDPADLGIRAHTHRADMATYGRQSAASAPVGNARTVAHLGAIYFLFGFTYVVYITFIVTFLVQERGVSERNAGYFWFAVGALSMFSGPVFGALSDRAGRGVGMAAVFALHTVSYLLVGLHLPIEAVYVSVAFFGFAAWSVPGIVAAAVGDYMGPGQAATTFGMLTVIFGLGQAIGPLVAGLLAEQSGGFSTSFLMASALAACACALSLALRPPEPAISS